MPTLAYWKIRGLAQPIRLLLTYAGEEFEDVQYEQGDAPELSRAAWTDVKPSFNDILDFPNESLKEDYFKNVQPMLALFEKKLGNNDWFVGNKPTVADFPMYELLDQHLRMKADSLDACPKLKAFLQRFSQLPKVKEYLAQDKVKNMPINNKSAAFK
ncbi:GSTM5-like protein [Mya arenaria]|uniref:glutathione transferase n=1 Tax=Mya arenaria TaxID=6604 RepID=A0ABY7FWH4_MYAAR|nr:GSTM5-like protein [Mya arenaria]